MSDNKLLKIGYTTNLNNRLHGLKTGNPLITVVSFKAGSKMDEKNLHEQCKEWYVDKEWYQDTVEVRKKFEEYNPFSDNEINLFKETLSKALLSIYKEKDYKYFWNKPIFRHFKEKVINIENIPEEYSRMLTYLKEAEEYCNALYCIKYIRKQDLEYVKSKYMVSKNIFWYISKTDLNFILEASKKKISKYNELQKYTEELKTDLSNIKTDYTRSIIESRLKNDLDSLNYLQKEIKENLDFLEKVLDKIK